MVGIRLNAFTGKILWYTLDFFPLSRQPQCGICRDKGRLIQCLAEVAPQHPLQPPHCGRIVRHLLRESLVDEGRQPQIFRRQINNTLIIFLYLHLSLVFLLKRLIFQGFPTFEFSFLFKVSSQIFSYFLMFFPAILVNPLVKQASLPTGFFNYSLSDILLPLHHQNSHGCKCSRLH